MSIYTRGGLHHKRFIRFGQLHRDAIAENILKPGKGRLQHFRALTLSYCICSERGSAYSGK